MNIEKLKSQLLKHEGFVSPAYQDSEGYWTIGIGRLIDERKGGGITEDEAYFLLTNDIERAETWARTYAWYDDLDEVRQNVVVEMIFNLGPRRFAGFKKMIAAIEREDWKEAAVQALNSKWASQVGNRALRLAEMMRSGRWP